MEANSGRHPIPFAMEEDYRNQEFRKVFGVSADELRQQGIDPDQYARDNIHAAYKKPQSSARWLTDEQQYARLWGRWGGRAYVAVFVALGLLFVQKALPRWAPVLIALEVIVWLAGLAMFALSVKYRRLQRKTRQTRLRR